MKKLSRAEIKAGFESIPIDTILLGSASTKQTKLTHKQREFAREIALGETKAGAYRKAYNHKGKSKTASNEGQKLVKNHSITTQIEAFKVAIEAQKYTTPAHLRALAIHKITEKALDPDCPPAQQLKALELLGKMTEVALFTERREIVQTTSSGDMKEKLMESIRMAISNSQAIDVEAHQADDLLAEIARGNSDSDDVVFHEVQEDDVVVQSLEDELVGEGFANGDSPTPPTPDPQILTEPTTPDLHSIPHIKSPPNSVLTPSLTPVRDESPAKSITCESSSKNPIGTPPVNDSIA